MRGLVSSVAVGKIDGKIALDLFDLEDNFGQADVPLAYMNRAGELTLLQMDGSLTSEEIKKAIEIGKKACTKIIELQKAALKERFGEEAKK